MIEKYAMHYRTSYNLSRGGCDENIEGYIALAISILARVSPDEAFKRLNNAWKPKPQRWTKELVMDIHNMRIDGESWGKIGKKLGRSPTYLQKKYSELCPFYDLVPVIDVRHE